MFNILLVDDTKAVHAYIRSILSKHADIQIQGVFDGAQALEKLKSDGGFDLVLLDWEMPILNGPQTLQELKTRGLSVPVIMVTTKNSTGDIMHMLNLGAADYMMKPFTVDILLGKIEMVCGKSFADVG